MLPKPPPIPSFAAITSISPKLGICCCGWAFICICCCCCGTFIWICGWICCGGIGFWGNCACTFGCTA